MYTSCFCAVPHTVEVLWEGDLLLFYLFIFAVQGIGPRASCIAKHALHRWATFPALAVATLTAFVSCFFIWLMCYFVYLGTQLRQMCSGYATQVPPQLLPGLLKARSASLIREWIIVDELIDLNFYFLRFDWWFRNFSGTLQIPAPFILNHQIVFYYKVTYLAPAMILKFLSGFLFFYFFFAVVFWVAWNRLYTCVENLLWGSFLIAYHALVGEVEKNFLDINNA